MQLIRATVMHTPACGNLDAVQLHAFQDGALVIEGGKVLACGNYSEMHERYPAAELRDFRGFYLLPGFIDTHVHFPQLPIIGSMGMPLMDWLEQRTLPAEAALQGAFDAENAAASFLRCLSANGTSTALVFGSHIFAAQDTFFRVALQSGIRIISGLSLGDRNLVAELERTPEQAREESQELINRYHKKGRLRYAVTPRFALSCSEAMLRICGELLGSVPDLSFQTHINENTQEIAIVRDLFPERSSYFDAYEHFGLATERSVFAHNIHVSNQELKRMAHNTCAVAHCPSSNAFLGSGSFPMRRHLEHDVRFGLGCDVGAGSGFSLLNEGLRAYETQMLREDGYKLLPEHLLYLATAGGARALGLTHETGDFLPGKSADFVLLCGPAGSTIAEVLQASDSCRHALGVLFTLAREDCVVETVVAGRPVYSRIHSDPADPTEHPVD